VWPGDTPYALERTWQIEPGCPVNVSRLTLSTHTGTHADAPIHYDEHGRDSAGVSLLPYVGLCVVVDARHAGEYVTPEDIVSGLPDRVERVLVRTFDVFPHDAWPTDFKAIAADTIDMLAARGCVLIGTDTPSLDPETSKTLDAHNRVKAHGLAILEGLVLDDVAPGAYELIALPLKIAGGDSSPVRAILKEITS
jgi:arylformamidase